MNEKKLKLSDVFGNEKKGKLNYSEWLYFRNRERLRIIRLERNLKEK